MKTRIIVLAVVFSLASIGSAHARIGGKIKGAQTKNPQSQQEIQISGKIAELRGNCAIIDGGGLSGMVRIEYVPVNHGWSVGSPVKLSVRPNGTIQWGGRVLKSYVFLRAA